MTESSSLRSPRYVECPDHHTPAPGERSVFLAGGITGTVDWQRTATAAFADTKVVVYNPRRKQFPIDDPSASSEQITWEHHYLHTVDLTVFWFPASDAAVTTQPIAMFELGAAITHPARQLVVGADPRYPRVLDIHHQLRLSRPDLTVHSTLDATLAAAQQLLGLPAPQHS